MKLYARSQCPRVEPFYGASAFPASAYRLEKQLQAAYAEQLYTWWEPDTLYETVFPGFREKLTKKGMAPNQSTINKRTAAIEDRLAYEVPDIVARMTPEELAVAADVLLRQTLVGFIWHVLAQERAVVWRMKEGNCYTRLNDDSHAQAAALGKKVPCACQARPIDPTDVHRWPAPLTAASLPVPPVPPTPAASSALPQPASLSLHLRVKQAQERKRLKRKRR